MRWSEIGVLMESLEGVALLACLQAHNLLWRKSARCVWDDSIDYERASGALYTQNGGVIFIHNTDQPLSTPTSSRSLI